MSESDLPHPLKVHFAREAVESARAEISERAPVAGDVVVDADRRAARWRSGHLMPLVNATGVLLHTNLGRAPLDRAALDAAVAAGGYTNLEFDLASGTRGSRREHAGPAIAAACGAEAALVVNNNAAAVLLVLAALARGREVIVSRGELVEIGGGFRVPDILAETGARLIEVGTTNRTRFDDYARARNAGTAVVLKVHASNYRMVGFTEATPVSALVDLGLPVVVDAGSGLLDATTPWLAHRPAWLADEPGVKQCLAEGAALVTFSGDKLFGGPQAGVIAGDRDLVEQLASQPLARALRPDKLTLAAMRSVALTYLEGRAGELPLWRMAGATVESLEQRARNVASVVEGARAVATQAAAGGGSVPGRTIPSAGVAVAVADLERALALLRSHGVVALARDGAVVCDLRSVDPAQDDQLGAALRDVALT